MDGYKDLSYWEEAEIKAKAYGEVLYWLEGIDAKRTRDKLL
jgi:hypothetical protein